ncbi:MAG: ATP-binding cassette, subfamily heavy metal transporter, partial [Sphingomonadales bacterium]|nr:ATP-binding cassette, subfamily heavy metal transporter [Sphingomonadales bacterium]
MRPLETDAGERQPGWSSLRRFLPYLWPPGEAALKARVIVSLGFVLLSILVSILVMPLVYGAAVDRMTAGMRGETAVVIALATAYAAARFGGVLFDNLRNAIFERVGQEAERRLAETTFRHLHKLSLRFHLDRRTGAVTKIIERGTKSIDMMLYFLLFNIAPTILQLVIVMGMFWFK